MTDPADLSIAGYEGSVAGVSGRARNTLFGMDEHLREICLRPNPGDGTFTPDEERLVRQAAHRYGDAVHAIKEALAAGAAGPEVVRIAQDALASFPADEPQLTGEHISARMCQWTMMDRWIDLARIADAGADPASKDTAVLALAGKVVARAYATLAMR